MLQVIYFAVVAELADALDLGSSGRPWGFKSSLPHHFELNLDQFQLFFYALCALFSVLGKSYFPNTEKPLANRGTRFLFHKNRRKNKFTESIVLFQFSNIFNIVSLNKLEKSLLAFRFVL